ncbi:MAG: hypothetical protein HC883_03845 [Bdellovibrionaceae bacterium]|nr:hypothetical protein [Pseudobdellovibrionaceae bacterium]
MSFMDELAEGYAGDEVELRPESQQRSFIGLQSLASAEKANSRPNTSIPVWAILQNLTTI